MRLSMPEVIAVALHWVWSLRYAAGESSSPPIYSRELFGLFGLFRLFVALI